MNRAKCGRRNNSKKTPLKFGSVPGAGVGTRVEGGVRGSRRKSLWRRPPTTPVYTTTNGKRCKRKDIQLYDFLEPAGSVATGPIAPLVCTSSGSQGASCSEESRLHNTECVTDAVLPNSTSTSGDYATRKTQLLDSWEELQPKLRSTHYASQAPPTWICCICDVTYDNIIVCHDCGPAAYFCLACSEKIHHVALLHTPSQWTGKKYVPVAHKKKFSMPWHVCSTQTLNWIKVIDCFGRVHEAQIPFCKCQSKAVTLLQLNLWPGSPVNPQIAVDIRLMTLCRSFLLEAHTALMAFCSAIQHAAAQWQDNQNNVNLYRVLVTESAAQYRRFAYDVQHLKDVCDSLPDGTHCPICSSTKELLPKVISLDGNFRLVRKKSSGSSLSPGYHAGKFFLPELPKSQPAVEISEHYQECSDFRAGDVIRSKKRSQKLDVTGLFGSICIHDYPQYFIDMNSGESLQYAVTMMAQFSTEPEIRLLYDIGCKLHAHLKATKNPLLEKIQLAVPLFHGYAHNSKCQMTYNPRRLSQFRMADGENMERLWSILDDFAYMTREMTPANRRDVLVDVLIHIGESGIANAGTFLARRFQNATKVSADANSTLDSILQSLNGSGYIVDRSKVRDWKRQEGQYFQVPKTKIKLSGQWKESYAITLKKWYNARQMTCDLPLTPEENNIRQELQSLDEKLKQIETKHKINRWQLESVELGSHLQIARDSRRSQVVTKLHREATERCHLLVARKNARGYDAVTKMAGLIKRVNGVITRLVKDYNSLADFDTSPKTTFEEAKTLSSPLYNSMTPLSNVPYHFQRKAVDSLCFIDRAKEEMEALRIELHALFKYYRDLQSSLHFSLAHYIDSNSHPGYASVIIKHILRIEQHQLNLSKTASCVFGETICVDTPFTAGIEGSQTHIECPGSPSAEADLNLYLELSDAEADGDDDLPTDDEL